MKEKVCQEREGRDTNDKKEESGEKIREWMK
jgi:hypothetical protein